MRDVDRTILRTLAVALAGTGLIIACSSSNTDSGGTEPGDDAGASSSGTSGSSGASSGTSGSSGTSSGEPPKACEKNGDCPSGVCNIATKTCAAASCKDGVKNQAESDIDCGGTCDKCDQGKACKAATDCKDGVCTDGKCIAPTNTDGVKNGNETGIDCGGTGNPKCADGQGCAKQDDCTSDYCKAGKCTAITPADGVKNGNETDIDCGGVGNARCADGLMCLADTDCTSDVCLGGVCQAPTTTDGKKNGNETDVDCGGGGGNVGCAAGLNCVASTDCASNGCDYNKKCAPSPSCTAHYGGDTCGTGGDGGYPGEAASWESCCKTIPVTTPSGGTVYMDKYPTTSGRMRVFLESINYDVRGFVQSRRNAGTLPVIPVTASTAATPVIDGVNPVFRSEWDPYLPVSFDGNTNAGELADCDQAGTCSDAEGMCPASKTCIAPVQQGIYTSIRNHLGGTIFKNNSQSSTGCYVGSPGTHSFRFPAGKQDGAQPEQTQDVYDTKTLNCVDYVVAQAFCVWDGGRLETFQEWQTAYGPSATPWAPAGDARTPVAPGSSTYWGCRFPWATDADQTQCAAKWDPLTKTVELADYKYSYEYPKKVNVDYIVHLTAPGRTKGRGPLGHSDLLGAGFELTSSVTTNASPLDGRHRWTGNGSWEVHDYQRTYTGSSMLLNKYGKLGMRCVKFAPN